MQATVLTIAGSDPTGGAGLQADLKTMAVIGVYAAAVVTCVTVQNSRGVKRVEPLSPELVEEQIRAVLEDHRVTHIKIGMVGTAPIAQAISSCLADFSGEIIVDPVLLSTTGQELLQPSALAAIKTDLIARATVVTPNLPELTIITGRKTVDHESALQAADDLLEEFGNLRVAVIKGGHVGGAHEVTDFILYRSKKAIKLLASTRPFINSRNTHGTGCVLASAYAAFHCLTGDDEQAFLRSTNFIQQALKRSSRLKIVRNPEGRGGLLYGPVNND
ncbi:MAG: bifunctional hydroxymethylpyrimidine kinase/phosphomethylpyrimidine kinase [Desulfobulbaceae bacterium]|nr:bifunctional hydroxymethylpyrimidine kinase/phosphomethylpyrimidine kinase [Desulfobulbaceae bacterium]